MFFENTRKRRNASTVCTGSGNVMEHKMAYSSPPPILCIGLTTAAGNLIIDDKILETLYSFQIDVITSLPGETQPTEYVLAAAIYNIDQHYSCILPKDFPHWIGILSLQRCQTFCPSHFAGRRYNCLPQEHGRTSRFLEAVICSSRVANTGHAVIGIALFRCFCCF